jgi:hypothetical protein
MRSLVASAIKLAFGVTEGLQETITFRKVVKTVNPVDGSVSEATTSVALLALVLPIDGGMIARGQVRPEDAVLMKKFLIESADLSPHRPDYFDYIDSNSEVYSVKSVLPDLTGSMWTVLGHVE